MLALLFYGNIKILIEFSSSPMQNREGVTCQAAMQEPVWKRTKPQSAHESEPLPQDEGQKQSRYWTQWPVSGALWTYLKRVN